MELLKAFGLGTLAQSSLLVAGLIVCWIKVPSRVVGILAGFGVGAMISAIAFDLAPEAEVHIDLWQTVVWMLIGVAIFLLGDRLVDKRFGSAGAGGAIGIVVGSVVNGVPESAMSWNRKPVMPTRRLTGSGAAPATGSRTSPRSVAGRS